MIQFHSLETPQLERFLERHKSGLPFKTDIDLDLVLRQILQKANEFVPSESGSILLDDPFRKVASRHENELVFIATFGDAGRDLVGQRLSAKQGIAGQVYQAGSPHLSADVKGDVFFYPEAERRLEQFERDGLGGLPVCMAKTHLSLSADPMLLNAPKDFRLTVRDIRAYTGAGWLVPLCGDIVQMPGLGTDPAAVNIDIDAEGRTVGLF